MNKIEPLQTLLKIYKDKHECLLQYLPDETTNQFRNHIFLDEDLETLYLDEMILLVSKSTGLIEKKGRTIKINENQITLRIQNKYNLCFQKDDYYLFKKQRRKKKNEKEFYESLLNNI